jgi:photosystem II stability/assembly factor-like uncharacterized protein
MKSLQHCCVLKNSGLTSVITMLLVWSTPMSSQWVQTSAPSGRVNRLFLDSTSIYAAYGDVGAHRSTDNGTSWISMNNGLTGGQLIANDLCQIDSGMMIGTGQGVWFTTDLGQNWAARNTGLPSVSFRNVSAMAVLGTNVYLNISTSTNGFFSTNRGLSWVSRGNNGGETSPILVRNSAMYVTGYVEVRKSTNNGTSWTSISGGLPSQLYGTQVIAVNETLYVSSNAEGIYRSTNNGGSWMARNNGLTGTALYVMSIAGNSSMLLAGTMSDGVFLSTNGGGSWLPVNQGLTSMWIRCLAIQPPYAYAATDPSSGSGRIWRRLLSDFVTSVDGETGVPDRFELGKNYPNPFNPSTTIQYSLPLKGHVTLKVYDALGKEVASLVSEVKNPGAYSVKWDASRVASGVYFYRLQAGSFVETKKLVLLR